LLDLTIFRLDPEKVTGLKLRGWAGFSGDPTTLVFVRGKDGTWTAKQPAKFPVDPDKVKSFLNGLSPRLKAERFISLGGKPRASQRLALKDDALEIEITVEGQTKPLQLTVGGEADKDKTYYATSAQLPRDVFTVEQEPFKEARKRPAYFRK
jgi:hypothetical protein